MSFLGKLWNVGPLRWWDNFLVDLTKIKAVLGIIICLLGIFFIFFVSLTKLMSLDKNWGPYLAIFTSTFLSCIFMIPLVSCFNHLVKATVQGSRMNEEEKSLNERMKILAAEVVALEANNRAKKSELEKLEAEKRAAKLSIKNDKLNVRINILEHAQFSVQSFENIAEVNLLKTHIKRTDVEFIDLKLREKIFSKGKKYTQETALLIATHDIEAKFGIDLGKIKIRKLDEDSIAVSGIYPKYTGAETNITTPIIKEIRKESCTVHDEVKNGETIQVPIVDMTVIQNKDSKRAQYYYDAYDNDFQRTLAEKFGFMDEAIIELAKKFIKVIFSSVYKNITFEDNEEASDGVPLLKYFDEEKRKILNEEMNNDAETDG